MKTEKDLFIFNLVSLTSELMHASEAGNESIYHQTLQRIEHSTKAHKQKLYQLVIIDLNEYDDDEL